MPKKKNKGREAPKDLTDKVGALTALVSIHDLLNQGSFQGFSGKRVSDAIDFVSSLHKQVSDEAKSHPDADLIPGLMTVQNG